MSRPLRIAWVLPFLRFTGGVRVVYEHTRGLLARGHDVVLVVPRAPVGGGSGPVARLRAWILDRWITRSREAIDAYGLADRVRRVPALAPEHLPAADVTIATAWQTADAVAHAPARCGRGAYFLQHYEVFEPALEPLVDATWRLPLERIVIAGWLADIARERFGVSAWGPVDNGVDLECFHPRGRVEHDPPVVGMMYETMAWKGTADGLAAIECARREVPGLGLHLFGRPRLRHRLAPGDRYERNPTQARLAAIYRECDLFLSPSWTEGWGLPPMEAMASECAVVATNVGGMPEYAIAGVTAIAVPPRDPAALARGLVRLATDREERRRMARAGREYIASFTWTRATGQLADVLARIAAGESA